MLRWLQKPQWLWLRFGIVCSVFIGLLAWGDPSGFNLWRHGIFFPVELWLVTGLGSIVWFIYIQGLSPRQGIWRVPLALISGPYAFTVLYR